MLFSHPRPVQFSNILPSVTSLPRLSGKETYQEYLRVTMPGIFNFLYGWFFAGLESVIVVHVPLSLSQSGPQSLRDPCPGDQKEPRSLWERDCHTLFNTLLHNLVDALTRKANHTSLWTLLQ